MAMRTGITFLRILSPFYFVISAKSVADGILRGAGMMKRFMIATFTDLVLRVGLAIVLSGTTLGAAGIWCAWPVGWSASTIASVCFVFTGLRNNSGAITFDQNSGMDAKINSDCK